MAQNKGETMIGQEEENKIINETKFAKWLSDSGDADSLDIPTKDIEVELRKVINLTKEKHDEQVHEDSKKLVELIWIETGKLRQLEDHKEVEKVVDDFITDPKDCLTGIARRIEDYSERTDWKFVLEKAVSEQTAKDILSWIEGKFAKRMTRAIYPIDIKEFRNSFLSESGKAGEKK